MPKSLFGKSENEKSFDTVYGTFTLRRPSLYLKQQMHIEASRMAAGNDLDWAGALDTFVMAQVTVYARSDEQIRKVIKDKPVGWPDDFSWATAYDFEFLGDLIRGFDEWVQSFRKPRESGATETGSVRAGADSGVPTEGALQPVANGPQVASDD